MERKSILFIADKPNWAYHNIIKTWAEGFPEYDCYIAFSNDFSLNQKNFSFIEKLSLNFLNKFRNKEIKYFITPSLKFSYPIHKNPPVYEVLSEKKVNKLHFDFIVEMSYYFQYTSQLPFSAPKKLVGIYTDSFPHDGPSIDIKDNLDVRQFSRKDFFEKYLKNYDGIIVGNSNLYEDYRSLTSKLVISNAAMGQEKFIENTTVGQKKHLTIGWTGNPNRPMKGFKEIIEPAIEEVKKTGREIYLKTKFSGSYEDLFTFYHDVDLIVIASYADASPSLFSEASLSGVPAISTKIGFPKMVIKDGINGIFVPRDIEAVKNAIVELYDNREKLIALSKKIKIDYLSVLDNKILINNLKSYIKTLS